MARVTISAQALPTDTNYSGAALTWTAADATNKEQTLSTGKELLLAWNSGSTERNIIVTSVADSLGRTRNMTLAIAATDTYAMFGPFRQTGWAQTDGNLYFEADHAEVKWAVLRLPAV